MSEEFTSFFNVISGKRFNSSLRNIQNYLLTCLSTKYPNINILYHVSLNYDFYFILEDISEDKILNLIDDRIVISLHSGYRDQHLMEFTLGSISQSHLHEGSSYNSVPKQNRLDLKIRFQTIPRQNINGQIKIIYKTSAKQIYIDFILCLQNALNQNPRIFTALTNIGTPTPYKDKKKYKERPEFITPEPVQERTIKSESESSLDDGWTTVTNRKLSYKLKYIKYKLKYLKLKEKLKYIKL